MICRIANHIELNLGIFVLQKHVVFFFFLSYFFYLSITEDLFRKKSAQDVFSQPTCVFKLMEILPNEARELHIFLSPLQGPRSLPVILS